MLHFIVIAGIIVAASAPQPDGRTIARRYFEEVWNQGKVDVLDELLAPDYINHTPSSGRILEHWRVTDELSLMRQIGAVQ
jgi:hypothetical protein